MDFKARQKKVKDSIRRSQARRVYGVRLTSRQWYDVLHALGIAGADASSKPEGYFRAHDSIHRQLKGKVTECD